MKLNPGFAKLMFLFVYVCLMSCQHDLPEDKQISWGKMEKTHNDMFSDRIALLMQADAYLMANLKKHYVFSENRSKSYMDSIIKHYTDIHYLRWRLGEMRKEKINVKSKNIYDFEVIDNTWLLNDLNSFFSTYYRTSWQGKIPNSIFKEYLLPYRIDKELLHKQGWRQVLQSKFLLDTNNLTYFAENQNIYSAANQIHKWLRKEKQGFDIKFGKNSLLLPPLPITYLDKLTSGSCRELADVTIGYLRAMGIPATIDIVPTYLNIGSGHEWAVIFDEKGRSIPFDIQNGEVGKFKHPDYKLSKVYRRTFSPSKNNHFAERGFCQGLPEFLNDPFLQDVTKEYGNVFSPKIEIDNDLYFAKTQTKKPKYVYLAVFGDAQWTIIDWGILDNDIMVFKDLKPGGIYLPLFYDDGNVNPASQPFLLNDDGTASLMKPDMQKRKNAKLYRKWPFSFQAPGYTKQMIGGKFQVANTAQFDKAILLHEITKDPLDTFNTISFSEMEIRNRYQRYIGPIASYANIAEMEIYADGQKEKCSGRVIGSEGSMWNNPDWTKEKVFDGNLLTYFSAAEADLSWVGLDLGSPKRIDSIRFLARNTKNGIYEGLVYELLYWDSKRGWISLGSKEGRRVNYLSYHSVPSTAVFWLRNLSEGREERIFTLEEGKQTWW